MKLIHITFILSCVFLLNCREQKKEEKMIPVEADGGIGDGAPSLDSLLKHQTPPVISEKKRDSLTIKTDSI
ncbi:hypothetical protein ULMS_23650 [Patiriisocius marinistellae]|uniref:Uncharacterized protein n=1 Tax=Patiriisocius marinistellae TaxID=2494560 RepID=A0A5J4FVX5_9FLAO|nr:hypothetical protein [Patiriisocius marinistellae]GEQ86857.1 hypothetical protein ULMS_23650 [Patiriisocius marinistellae]